MVQEIGTRRFGLTYSSGQIFIVGAIFITLGLLLIFTIISATAVTEEKRFQETQALEKTAKNILNEYRFAAALATYQSQPNVSAAEYLGNMTSLARNDVSIEAVHFVAFANTSSDYSVTIVNYLDRTLNFTLTTNYSATASAMVRSSTAAILRFNTSSQNVRVNITYDGTTESMAFTLSQKKYLAAVFDFTVSDAGSFIRIKDSYNRTW